MPSARILRTLLRAPLGRLLAAWVEVRLIEPPPATPAIDPALPTLYVLPRPALTDTLLLETLTRQQGLPEASQPRRLGARDVAACLALPATERRRWRRALRAGEPFRSLFEAYRDTGQDLQLVPVSVFWGRAPGKPFGLWRLLAADSWRLTGRLRRLLSVLVNGRDVEVYFGTPLRLGALDDNRAAELTGRKVARLLRVHFRGLRTRVLGPDLSHRRTLIEGVVTSPAVQQAIDEVAAAEHQSPARLARRARRYGREIAADMTYPVMRFLAGGLRRLWNRLYDGVDVYGLERVKALAGDHTLVYVPCHRSHIDYLLLSYVLYREGLMPPHIAAGRNLDMPLIGPLLRRGGAFFMRRSFRDNRLYGAVFNEYLHRLLARGHPLEYFMEGGRSRSGRLLPPRPGMLAMTLRSFLRSHAQGGQGVVFVPVYLGYERILENASYQRELRGGRKRKETPLALLGVLGRLRQPFGRVAVNIGDPLSLETFLDQTVDNWRQTPPAPRPAWLSTVVPRLGRTLAQRINAAATLNSVNLVALALLATPHHALEASQLEHQLALLVALRRRLSGGQPVNLPDGSPAEWLEQTVALGMVERRPHALGDVIVARADQAALLAWYRNNVLHLFALAGLTAFAFRHQACQRLDDLVPLLAPAWSALARELSVASPRSLHSALAETLEALTAEGLLEQGDSGWCRPRESLAAGEQLSLLGRLIQPSLERGYLLLAVLLDVPSGHFGRETLTERSRQLAERLALLTGRDAPEFFDTRLFEGLVESLLEDGWLTERQGRLWFDDRLRDAARRSRTLFAPSLRHRLQLVARPGVQPLSARCT